MAKIPDSEETIEMMVNCKTYPAVSKKYTETVCTGGVRRDGSFVRLYPVPFRFLQKDEQYARWDIIRVKTYRDTKDTRPESRHLVAGTPIERIGAAKTNKQKWDWMRPTVHTSTAAMSEAGITNGCVAIEPLDFFSKPDPKEWSASQRAVIEQGDLFATHEQMKGLSSRIPWQFRLRYREINSGREAEAKVLAWSYYQGLLRWQRTLGETGGLDAITEKVRSSIFCKTRTVFAIFGTHSRSGHWMISALYHLPTSVIDDDRNVSGHLF